MKCHLLSFHFTCGFVLKRLSCWIPVTTAVLPLSKAVTNVNSVVSRVEDVGNRIEKYAVTPQDSTPFDIEKGEQEAANDAVAVGGHDL